MLQDGNEYTLSEDTVLELQKRNVWAIFIDNATMKVVWQTDNLPETIPMSYSVSDIANLPKTVLFILTINIALIFIIYMTANSKLLKSVKPIASGIQALSANEEVHISEKGLLSELAVNINKTSDILQTQNRHLRKRETARANWIAGVSHDIRTPLSMVMGYAAQLESDKRLPEDDRKKAAVIVNQSERMRNLINDLNLASKLEYNMQPIHSERQNLVAIVRQVVSTL